jgi:hypothetical protein
MPIDFNSNREIYRHIVATLVYRVSKTLRDAPEHFATFQINSKSRTSIEILAHIGDLFDWALSMAKGKGIWHESVPNDWEKEVARFYKSVKQFDTYLANGSVIACPAEKLFQGPLADAFTHVGQLAMMRRIAGVPIKGENYFVADIAIGRVGAEQSEPVKEFD